ncbi:hypothetical protein GE21DRAFT_1220805, partial [Neurospora crassa]
KCCISWGKVFENGHFPVLAYAAKKLMDACAVSNSKGEVLVSGMTSDTLVGGACLY